MIFFIFFQVSFSISIPDLIYYEKRDHVLDEKTTLSMCELHKDLDWIKVSNIITIITSYTLPLLIIIISYGRLLAHMHSSQKTLVVNRL